MDNVNMFYFKSINTITFLHYFKSNEKIIIFKI